MLCEIADFPITNILPVAVEILNQSDVLQCQLHYLLLLVLISLLDLIQNCLLAGFLQNNNEEQIIFVFLHKLYLHLSTEEEFVKDEIRFFKIEDDVKLTDRSEIFVQDLHISVDHLQSAQFIVPFIHGEAEEEAGVPFVDNAHIFVLYEVTHLGFSLENHPCKLSDDFLLVFGILGIVPFLQSQLALSTEEQDKMNHV